MSKKQITVEVSAAAHDVGTAVVNLSKVVKERLADGWDPLSDTPTIVLAALQQFSSVVGKLQHLPAEVTEDTEAFARAFGNIGFDLWNALIPAAKKA